MNAQDFAVFALGDNLDEPFMLPEDRGFTVGKERKFSSLDIETLFAGLPLPTMLSLTSKTSNFSKAFCFGVMTWSISLENFLYCAMVAPGFSL